MYCIGVFLYIYLKKKQGSAKSIYMSQRTLTMSREHHSSHCSSVKDQKTFREHPGSFRVSNNGNSKRFGERDPLDSRKINFQKKKSLKGFSKPSGFSNIHISKPGNFNPEPVKFKTKENTCKLIFSIKVYRIYKFLFT
jgi:hypothetical protein